MPNYRVNTGGPEKTSRRYVTTAKRIDTTSPLQGGGDLTSDLVLSIDMTALASELSLASAGTPTEGFAVLTAGAPLAPQRFTGFNRFDAQLTTRDVQISGAGVTHGVQTFRKDVRHTSGAGGKKVDVERVATVYLGGTSVTVTGLCPNGGTIESLTACLVSGANTLVNLGLEGGTDNVWGGGIASGVNTKTSHRDWKIRSYPIRTGPTNFTVTASGGGAYSFDKGVVRVTSFVTEHEG